MHNKIFDLRVSNLLHTHKLLVEIMRRQGKTCHQLKVESADLTVYMSVINDSDSLEVIDKRARIKRRFNLSLESGTWSYDIATARELSTVERGMDLLIRKWDDAWMKVRGLRNPWERLYPCLLRSYHEIDTRMQNLVNEYYTYTPADFTVIDMAALVERYRCIEPLIDPANGKDQTAVNGVLIPYKE